jgi:hypothetical protein
VRTEDKAVALLLGAVGTKVLISMVYGAIARRHIKQGKKLDEADIPDLIRLTGAPEMPVVRIKGLNNAFYGKLWHLGRLGDQLPEDVKEKGRRHGVVAYDPEFRNEAVLAHEAGHAEISNRPWHNLSRLNQNVLRPLGALSPLAGMATYALLSDRYGRRDPRAVTAAVATAAAGRLPTLISEYQASRLGMAGLDKLYAVRSLSDRAVAGRSRRNSKALRHAFGTYALNAGLSAAVTAALLGTDL